MTRIYRERRSEFWVALLTTLMVIFIGVEQGIILAIVLSLIDHTRRGYHPRNAVLKQGESGAWKAEPVASRAQALPGLIVYRFTHSLYYANTQQFLNEVMDLVNNTDPPLRWLCLDASAVDDVDFSAAETLRSLFGMLQERGIHLVITRVMDDLKDESRYHLVDLFGEDAFYDTLEEALQAYRRVTGSGH